MIRGLKNYARILRASVRHDQPVYAHMGLTHRCDLTCRMCGIWKYGNEEEELSLAELARVADVMAELGVVQVSLGGGEPFCRPDLAEIVHIFRQRQLSVRVLTNGVNLAESRMKEVADAGLEAVSVSLDTLSRSRFAWIAMDPEAWDKVVTNLHRFSRLLPAQGTVQVMNCVVSRENLLELPELVAFAGDLGYHLSLLPVELAEDPTDRSNRFITWQPRLALSAEDIARVDEVYARLLTLKAQGAAILSTTPFLEASREYFKTGRFPLPCDAGILYFSVNPAGMMTICHRGIERKSMLDADMVPFFRSQAFQAEARQEAAACPGCIRACWIDTGFIFHTVTGFLESTRLGLASRAPRDPIPLDQALARGRP